MYGEGTTIGEGPNHRIAFFDGPIFVVRLFNVPTGQDVRDATAVMKQHPRFRDPFAMIFTVTSALESYDRSLLEVYRASDQEKPPMPAFMGVVLRNPMHRVVVSSVAVGFRFVTRRSLEVFEDESDALTAARAMLPRRSIRPEGLR
jgi:hypothetical protein